MQLTKTATITLGPLQVSDLFFNADHKHYNGLFGSNGGVPEEPTESEVMGALTEDAKEFIESLPGLEEAYGYQELVDNFLSRL